MEETEIVNNHVIRLLAKFSVMHTLKTDLSIVRGCVSLIFWGVLFLGWTSIVFIASLATLTPPQLLNIAKDIKTVVSPMDAVTQLSQVKTAGEGGGCL